MPVRTRAKGLDWPLVGRAEELELLRGLRTSRPPTSAVISGPAGVGKSRLAAAAVEQAAAEGWATHTIRGSRGLSAVPLGPFRALLDSPGSSDLSELVYAVERALVAMRAPRGLLLLVDDCQALDEHSAGLLHQLAAAGSVLLVATIRVGSTPQSALVDLWKDGLAERLELQSLSKAEAGELLSSGLGGAVEDSSANRIWQVTGGNPLYLREVVLSGLESGALSNATGDWRWRGKWTSGSRLQEIVTTRFGRLDPDELTALEMLAVAGPLPLGIVVGLTTSRAVEGLAQRSLVVTEQSGGRTDVSIAHPLHAEVLRDQMPPLQQRALRRNLVDAVQATGARRVFDRVRLACWSLESGLEVDPLTLSLGSTASLFGVSQAIASRLAEVMPGAQAIVNMGMAVPRNHDLAVRLARVAYERSDGVVEGVALASTLAWTGAIDAAAGMLAEVEAKVDAIDDRLRLATALSWVQFWGRFDVEAAEAGLHAALEVVTPEADRTLVANVYEQMAGIALNTSRPRQALEFAERAAEVLDTELSHTPAAAVAAAALSYLGRCSETLSLVDRAVPEAQKGGHPLHVANLLFARAAALARSGQLEEGRRLAEWLRDVATSRDVLDAAASVGVLIGEIFLRQGKPASAGRVLRDCAGLLAERDVFGYRTWALAGLARARARTGDNQAAAQALGEAQQSRLIGRHYDLAFFSAESEVHALEGRSEPAIEALERAADWSRRAGMVIDEAYALDALVRLSPSTSLAERLAELVTLTDSEIVAVTAAHARALVAGDAGGLLRVAERFAEMTAWWMATEAAAAASRIFERSNDTKAAKAAARAATTYLSHCEGARSSLESPDEHSVLTKRELEIATLAATGHSNKDIAATTYLSQRTVENHLYHAYTKLGVADRADLAAALLLPE